MVHVLTGVLAASPEHACMHVCTYAKALVHAYTYAHKISRRLAFNDHHMCTYSLFLLLQSTLPRTFLQLHAHGHTGTHTGRYSYRHTYAYAQVDACSSAVRTLSVPQISTLFLHHDAAGASPLRTPQAHALPHANAPAYTCVHTRTHTHIYICMTFLDLFRYSSSGSDAQPAPEACGSFLNLTAVRAYVQAAGHAVFVAATLPVK